MSFSAGRRNHHKKKISKWNQLIKKMGNFAIYFWWFFNLVLMILIVSIIFFYGIKAIKGLFGHKGSKKIND